MKRTTLVIIALWVGLLCYGSCSPKNTSSPPTNSSPAPSNSSPTINSSPAEANSNKKPNISVTGSDPPIVEYIPSLPAELKLNNDEILFLSVSLSQRDSKEPKLGSGASFGPPDDPMFSLTQSMFSLITGSVVYIDPVFISGSNFSKIAGYEFWIPDEKEKLIADGKAVKVGLFAAPGGTQIDWKAFHRRAKVWVAVGIAKKPSGKGQFRFVRFVTSRSVYEFDTSGYQSQFHDATQ